MRGRWKDTSVSPSRSSVRSLSNSIFFPLEGRERTLTALLPCVQELWCLVNTAYSRDRIPRGIG